MALDYSAYERECRSMGGLFQQLAHDMKNSSSVWQDFISKANKFHASLGSTTTAMTSFLDAFQKIADMANNSKGAVRDIGGTLTKLCLRQRSLESKLKEFVTILGGTFSPIPGLLDDWKKTVVQMDQAHGKEYKKLNNEIQKNLTDANKLKKQVEKGGRAEKLQPSLDSKIKAVEWKYSDLATNESVALKKLALHERQRFSFFVKCLTPLLEKQHEILMEASSLEEAKSILLEQTNDPDGVIKYCEDFVDEFRVSNSDQQQQLTFVTPPSTPHCLTRHSSSLSIRSSNSALNQLRRPHSQINQQQQQQEHSDRQSLISNSVSTAGGTFETDSLISQDIGTKTQLTTNGNPGNSTGDYTRPCVMPNNNNNNNNNICSPSDMINNNATSPLSNILTSFGADRRSMTHSTDSLLRKKQGKTTPGRAGTSEIEDAELLLAHRTESNRPFNRSAALRNSITAPNKSQSAVQPLDSPVRPGRKNDKRATLGYGGDYFFAQNMGQNTRYLPSASSYATLGRSSFKGDSARTNFFGGNFSTGKIGQSIPNSPPPPPPPLPAIYNDQAKLANDDRVQNSHNDQLATLLRAHKKTTAPLPPTQSPASPPLPPPPAIQSHFQSRSSYFNYSPQYSVVSSTSYPPSPQTTTQNNSACASDLKQHQPQSLNVTIPYYKTQVLAGDKTPTSPKSSSIEPANQYTTGNAGLDSGLSAESMSVKGSKQQGSPVINDVPIRILRKYPDGLVTPSGAKHVSLGATAPPKPPPPLRNSSMTTEENINNFESQQQQQQQQQPSRQLSRNPSIKQQSAPKDCPSIPKAMPLNISDLDENRNKNNNNNKSGVGSSTTKTSNATIPTSNRIFQSDC